MERLFKSVIHVFLIFSLILAPAVIAGKIKKSAGNTPGVMSVSAGHSDIPAIECFKPDESGSEAIVKRFDICRPKGNEEGRRKNKVERLSNEQKESLARRLTHAVRNGRYQNVLALLNDGADPNMPCFNSCPIAFAVRKKPSPERSLVVKALFANGGNCLADIDCWESKYSDNVLSILFTKLWDGEEDVRLTALATLTEKNMNINDVMLNEKPILHHLLCRPSRKYSYSAEAIELLLKNGMDVDIPLSDRCLKTPLVKSLEVVDGHTQKAKAIPVARLLIRYGAALCSESSWYSPLGLLLRDKWDDQPLREEVFDAIRKAGTDINCVCAKKQSLMIHVLTDSQVSIQAFRQLISTGLYPLFIRGERPFLFRDSGNIPIKKMIRSMYAGLWGRRHLQFLCMKAIYKTLRSRKTAASLPIRSGFNLIIFGGDAYHPEGESEFVEDLCGESFSESD